MTRLPVAVQEAGYAVFPPSQTSLAWAQAASTRADAVLADPTWRDKWLVCGGTWFVGVDALTNDTAGAIAGVPLAGPAVAALGALPTLHPAQLSVTYPGYPKPRDTESPAAFRYRQRRDAAHVDGILAEGPDKRRFVREPHAFILGIALSQADPGASPLVVWPESHHLMRAAFRAVLGAVPPDRQAATDITEVYQSIRQQVFDTCPRVPVPLTPGAAVLLHPMMLHGVAPWLDGAKATGGRQVAYFRPLAGSVQAWLDI